MPVEDFAPDFLGQFSWLLIVKAFLILFLIFYSVFALILYRQIRLMTKTLPTPFSPILSFIGIVHIGVTLALFFVMIGAF